MYFTVSADEMVDAEMMYRMGNYKVHHSRVLEAKVLEMPYKGDRYAMFIILPNEDTTLADVTARMTPETLNDTLTANPDAMKYDFFQLILSLLFSSIVIFCHSVGPILDDRLKEKILKP